MINDNNGHWINTFSIDTKQFGFVYLITNKTTGKKYIGCKQFKVKKGKQYINSGWQSYTGSNKELNSDISILGKSAFEFKIVTTVSSKAELKYAEATLILMTNAIYSSEYYNQWISIKLKGKKLAVK